MKGSKSTRQHYGNTERKSNKRSDKPTKLDRKSSRGMIYENEELRLRTININAEVERGQSDIKRLRNENAQLRREVWSLRDEYDRLNKKFKTKFVEPEPAAYNARCSQGACSCQCNDGSGGGCETGHSKCNSEYSDSCDSCCCHDEEDDDMLCDDECCNETKTVTGAADQGKPSPTENNGVAVNENCPPPPGPSILTNFDHLSVVSEETLSNSEVLTQNTENLLGYTPDISGSQTTLPSLVGPLTPLTPIELVANELNDLQACVPPLSYFENILQQHINSSSTPGTSSSNSGKTVIRHTNGWDYNLQSPFSQKRYPANSVSPIMQQRSTAQKLTTFVPSTTVTPPPPAEIPTTNGKSQLPALAVSGGNSQDIPVIETIPITTMSVNGCASQQAIAMLNANTRTTTTTTTTTNGSNDNTNINNGNIKPKHFFAPIKPKLKLNTALANQRRMPPPPPPAAPLLPTSKFANGVIRTQQQQQKFEPPDIYVTNGLATPYKHPMKPAVQPPPIPQRITSNATSNTTSAQVSLPRQRRKLQRQYQSNQQLELPAGHEHHLLQHRHHHHHSLHSLANHVADKDDDDDDGDDANKNDCDAAVAAATGEAAVTRITNMTTDTITTTTVATPTTITPRLMSPTNLKTTLTSALLASNILCNFLNVTLTTAAAASTQPSSATSTVTTPSLSSVMVADASSLLPSPVTCLHAAGLASFKFINSNICMGKSNEPVYAIAQNVCHNLIIAPAVRQPLMSSIVKCCPSAITPKKCLTTAVAGSIITTTNFVGGTTTMPACMLAPNIEYCVTSSINCSQTPTAPAPAAAASTVTASTNCLVVDSICQTDSANLESILNDIEAISEDILAIQLEKTRSRENLEQKSTEVVTKVNATPLQQDVKNSKPYRSEMNLLLTYDGNNPTIIQAHPTAEQTTAEDAVETLNGTARRTRSLERDHTDSPSPHIPDPMQPFPDNRKYIGFDRLNNAAAVAAPRVAVTGTQTSPIINTPLSHKQQLPLSPLVTNINLPGGKAMPPTPPARSYPSPLNIKCAGIQRSSSVTYKPNTNSSPLGSPVLGGVHPNKSQLFSAIANAAARRAQFRSQPTHMTQSLDTDYVVESTNCPSEMDEKETAENARRKARRVSIVCADTDSPDTPEKPVTSIRTVQVQNSTTASCSDLPSGIPNPALRNLKQTSHSTPNSPHSARKHEGSPLNTPVQQTPIISITPTTPSHQHGRGNGLQHHHAHPSSYPNTVGTVQQQRKNSQDTIKASAAEIACAAANAVRSKCSRRHSDGTVSHTNQRSSGTSGGTNGGHHHTHHPPHHHHQHSSSLVSNSNPHHSHHSHQDSNHETVASYSDRNSNSLASSRESSASFSMRSTRRKLSVSSNTGGKIPWCGCWGNGCL